MTEVEKSETIFILRLLSVARSQTLSDCKYFHQYCDTISLEGLWRLKALLQFPLPQVPLFQNLLVLHKCPWREKKGKINVFFHFVADFISLWTVQCCFTVVFEIMLETFKKFTWVTEACSVIFITRWWVWKKEEEKFEKRWIKQTRIAIFIWGQWCTHLRKIFESELSCDHLKRVYVHEINFKLFNEGIYVLLFSCWMSIRSTRFLCTAWNGNKVTGREDHWVTPICKQTNS